MDYKTLLPSIIMFLSATSLFSQKVVRYELYIADTLVNFSGKEKRAIAANGQIPNLPTNGSGYSSTIHQKAEQLCGFFLGKLQRNCDLTMRIQLLLTL